MKTIIEIFIFAQSISWFFRVDYKHITTLDVILLAMCALTIAVIAADVWKNRSKLRTKEN